MKKICLFLLAICTLFCVQAQKSVYPLPLDSGKTVSGNTLCYMLPTTALQMTVTVEKVREYKGHYADYAESLLGLSHVITDNRTYYKIKDVKLTPVTVPDTKNAYMVCLSGSEMGKYALAKVSKQNDFVPGFSQEAKCYTTKTTPIPNFFKNYSDPSFTEQEDSYVETKIIDGVVTQVPSNRTKLVSRSNAQKAQEAADAISKSRKDQYALVAGEQEVAYDATTINIMLNELKQWEQNYLSLFTGLVLTDELEYTFYVTPEDLEMLPVFTFSTENGLSVENLATASNPYALSFKPIFPTTNVEENVTIGTKATKNTGYRFRQAVPVAVSLEYQQETIHDFGTIDMLQGGRIQILPNNQKNVDLQNFGFIF